MLHMVLAVLSPTRRASICVANCASRGMASSAILTLEILWAPLSLVNIVDDLFSKSTYRINLGGGWVVVSLDGGAARSMACCLFG